MGFSVYMSAFFQLSLQSAKCKVQSVGFGSIKRDVWSENPFINLKTFRESVSFSL